MGRRGQPPKRVIAIPSAPVKQAGAKELHFSSVKDAANYVGMFDSSLIRIMKRDNCSLPSCGFYFDYEIGEDD